MGSFTGASEKRMKQSSGNGGPVSYGNSAKGTGRKGPFIGCPEECIKEGSGNGHLSPVRGPCIGCCSGTLSEM